MARIWILAPIGIVFHIEMWSCSKISDKNHAFTVHFSWNCSPLEHRGIQTYELVVLLAEFSWMNSMELNWQVWAPERKKFINHHFQIKSQNYLQIIYFGSQKAGSVFNWSSSIAVYSSCIAPYTTNIHKMGNVCISVNWISQIWCETMCCRVMK